MLVALLAFLVLLERWAFARWTTRFSKLAVVPAARPVRLLIDEMLAEIVRAEAGEAAYRMAPERKVHVDELPWPADHATYIGPIRYFEKERTVVVRSEPWWSRALLGWIPFVPVVGRVVVHTTEDSMELRLRLAPLPLSVMFVVTCSASLLLHPRYPELSFWAFAYIAIEVTRSVLTLHRQLDAIEEAFKVSWESALGARFVVDFTPQQIAEAERKRRIAGLHISGNAKTRGQPTPRVKPRTEPQPDRFSIDADKLRRSN